MFSGIHGWIPFRHISRGVRFFHVPALAIWPVRERQRYSLSRSRRLTGTFAPLSLR